MSRTTITSRGPSNIKRNIDSNKIVVGKAVSQQTSSTATRKTLVSNPLPNKLVNVDNTKIVTTQSDVPWVLPNALTVNYTTYNLDSTGLAIGIDPNYDNLDLLTNNAGALTITGNGTSTASIFKTSGSSSWDTHVYSNVAYTAPCTIEFNKQAVSGDNGASYSMIGWNTDPLTNASYDSIDYAAYPYRTDVYSVYHNGSQVLFSGSWNPASKFYITYATDGFIYHYNGSTLLYSVNRGTGATVYFDSSFYAVNGTYGGFSNIRVTKRAYNGTGYVGGSSSAGPIGPRYPGTVATAYGLNNAVNKRILSERFSIKSNPIVYYGEDIDNRKTILVNSTSTNKTLTINDKGTPIVSNPKKFYGEPIDNRKTILSNANSVPYNAAELRKKDITIYKSEVSTVRTIDSNVAGNAGSGGSASILDKQVWY